MDMWLVRCLFLFSLRIIEMFTFSAVHHTVILFLQGFLCKLYFTKSEILEYSCRLEINYLYRGGKKKSFVFINRRYSLFDKLLHVLHVERLRPVLHSPLMALLLWLFWCWWRGLSEGPGTKTMLRKAASGFFPIASHYCWFSIAGYKLTGSF